MRYGLLNDRHHLDKRAVPRLVDRYCALAEPARHDMPHHDCPTPRLMVDAQAQKATLERLDLGLDRPILALCPGAEFGTAKRWPAHHYAEVARAKIAAGWQVWLFGSTKDRQVTHAVDQLTGGQCIDLAGSTSLSDAVDLLALASAVVTNDSGLMHLAAAVNVPVLAIYGSSDPRYTPPLSGKARIVSLNLECSPCFKRECPLGHLNCLNKISPEMVLADSGLSLPEAP